MSEAAVRVPGRPVDPARRIIVTPEGLSLPLTLAGRGARLGALLIDVLMIGAVFLAAIIALGYLSHDLTLLPGRGAPRAGVNDALQLFYIVFVIGGFLLHNGWFLYFELGPRGATPGKRALGIRVAARDGGQLTPEMIIARNLLRDVELFMPLIFIAVAGAALFSGGGGPAELVAAGWFLLFALFPFFNLDRLRAGDLIAGTWVVEAQKRRLLPAMSLEPARGSIPPLAHGSDAVLDQPPGYRFGDAELAVYGEHELQTLEKVLRDDRPETMAAVAETICAKIGWSAPGSGETRPFLQDYYTQLRARLESGMRFGKRKADKFAGGA